MEMQGVSGMHGEGAPKSKDYPQIEPRRQGMFYLEMANRIVFCCPLTAVTLL